MEKLSWKKKKKENSYTSKTFCPSFALRNSIFYTSRFSFLLANPLHLPRLYPRYLFPSFSIGFLLRAFIKLPPILSEFSSPVSNVPPSPQSPSPSHPYLYYIRLLSFSWAFDGSKGKVVGGHVLPVPSHARIEHVVQYLYLLTYVRWDA